jgi:hypothetical protein
MVAQVSEPLALRPLLRGSSQRVEGDLSRVEEERVRREDAREEIAANALEELAAEGALRGSGGHDRGGG